MRKKPEMGNLKPEKKGMKGERMKTKKEQEKRTPEEIAALDAAAGLTEDRQLYKSEIRPDETVDEYLTRMAEEWHPEELR